MFVLRTPLRAFQPSEEAFGAREAASLRSFQNTKLFFYFGAKRMRNRKHFKPPVSRNKKIIVSKVLPLLNQGVW
jgi:hypothetical protein